MKVYIVHPNYDYGVHSVHATMEGARAEVQRHEEAEWEHYSSYADISSPIALMKKDFVNQYYIAEIEVQP